MGATFTVVRRAATRIPQDGSTVSMQRSHAGADNSTIVNVAPIKGFGESDDARAQRLRRLRNFYDGQNSTHLVLRERPVSISHGLNANIIQGSRAKAALYVKWGQRQARGLGATLRSVAL